MHFERGSNYKQAAKYLQQWGPRAVTSLARLYQNQNKQEEARDLFAQVYDRITEGFDTVDLREAKALLDELS